MMTKQLCSCCQLLLPLHSATACYAMLPLLMPLLQQRHQQWQDRHSRRRQGSSSSSVVAAAAAVAAAAIKSSIRRAKSVSWLYSYCLYGTVWVFVIHNSVLAKHKSVLAIHKTHVCWQNINVYSSLLEGHYLLKNGRSFFVMGNYKKIKNGSLLVYPHLSTSLSHLPPPYVLRILQSQERLRDLT